MSVPSEIFDHLSKREKLIFCGNGETPTWSSLEGYLDVPRSRKVDAAQIVQHLKQAAFNIARSRVPKAPQSTYVTISHGPYPEIVRHNKDSALTKYITLASWNASGFTKIRSSQTLNSSKWMRAVKPAVPKTPTTLYDATWTHVDDSSVLMFHGTLARFEKSIISQILWQKSDGVLGKGFYMTHNPNNAKAYACRAKNLSNKPRPHEDCIVFEIVVKDAKKIKRVLYDDVEFNRPNHNTSTFVLNSEKYFDGQVCLRGTAPSNLQIKRVHVFDCQSMMVRGTDDNGKLQRGC